jgi:hypothetical protein
VRVQVKLETADAEEKAGKGKHAENDQRTASEA